jgi:hypothetical protein
MAQAAKNERTDRFAIESRCMCDDGRMLLLDIAV